jgi:hypothetical protein
MLIFKLKMNRKLKIFGEKMNILDSFSEIWSFLVKNYNWRPLEFLKKIGINIRGDH